MPVWVDHSENADDENCPICAHTGRKIFENAFVGGEKVSDLIDLFDVSEGWAYAHARAFGFFEARVDNTAQLYGRIINDYLNTSKPKEVTARDALKAAEMRDRLAGRGQKERHAELPKIVFIEAPGPRNAIPAKVIEAEAEPVALPPGPGSAVEE